MRVCFAYYQAVIVCLDCSSDIQQIKPKGDILSRVTGSIREKALNVMNAHYEHTISVLKVTAGVCTVCGCAAVYGLRSSTVLQRNWLYRDALCYLFLTSLCFLLSSVEFFFPHLNYCLMLRVYQVIMPLNAIICSQVSMWIKLNDDGMDLLA